MSRGNATAAISPFITLSGAVLLAMSGFIVRILPRDSAEIIYAITLLTWITALFLCIRRYARPPFSEKTALRFVLVMAIFTLSIVPLRHGAGEKLLLAIQFLSGTGIVLVTFGLLTWKRLHPCCAQLHRALLRHYRLPSGCFVWGLYLLFLIITVSLSWYCFSFLPAYNDSIAQYVHAKFIAAGHLYGHSHPFREFFPVWLMINHGKWYSQYQPLHVFILGLGTFFGTPWMVNPLEGALTLIAIYALTRRMYDEATARLAAALTLGCQFILFMSSEYMNHATALLFVTLFMLCYVETLARISQKRHSAACAWALATGLGIGAVFLTRPFTAIGIALPFVIHALHLLRRNAKTCLEPFAIMVAGSLACVVLDGWYNLETTGNALLLPTSYYHNGTNSAALGMGAHISLSHMLFKAQDEWRRVNIQLFEWPVPSTIFVMLLCLLPLKNFYSRLLLAVLASHTIVNFVNQFSSNTFGPRYMYETSGALIILTAGGIRRLPLLLRLSRVARTERLAVKGIVDVSILCLFASSVLFKLPQNIDRYANHYFFNHPDFYVSMIEKSEKPALIFVGRNNMPPPPDKPNDPSDKYQWVAYLNPPADDDEVIFACDRGDEHNLRLLDYYPNRHAYISYDNNLVPVDRTRPSPAPKTP